jgi:hypothetical protein
LAVLASVMASAAAQTPPTAAPSAIPNHPALTDRFYFSLGGFWPSTTTSAQLDSTRTGVGANIDFENALNIARDDTVPGFMGRWRINNRWRVEAEYFELNRSGSRTIDRDIQFGDRVFPINAVVNSQFNFSDLRISAGYSFFRTPDKELGVGLGLHATAYDISLSANSVGSQSEDVTAPLPVLSVYGQFALTQQWAVAARLDRLSLSYDKYDGSLTALGLDLMWQPFRHVGFGLGQRSLYISLTATDADRTLKVKQALQGPIFYVNVSF